MKSYIVLIITLVGAVMISSCSKEEFKPYDHPFVHIHHNNSDQVRIQANRQEEAAYHVYLSSQLQFENTTVTFEITHGDGLLPGRDFEILTQGNTLVFPAGVFEMPIRIRWLRNTLEPGKEHTLVIRLIDNDRGYTVGMPGPDQLQRSLTITKF